MSASDSVVFRDYGRAIALVRDMRNYLAVLEHLEVRLGVRIDPGDDVFLDLAVQFEFWCNQLRELVEDDWNET